MTDVSAADTTMLKDTTTTASNTNKYVLKLYKYILQFKQIFGCWLYDVQGYHHHWLKYHRDGQEGKFLLVAYDSRVSIAPLK